MTEFEETLAPTAEFDITNMPLQEITMSQTLPLTNGENTRPYGENSSGDKDGTTMARSGDGGGGGGGGGGGVGYGRTMKEYEDELSSLKKENFQLKLRIYLLEEGNPTRNGISFSDEDVIKTNVELKEELEKLRKELMEKQVLLNQAARAFKLYEEQKAATSRTQDQYQQSLEKEREKVIKLERELAEYRERELDTSTYYKETFGITPEQALKNAEKLRQMEELVASLEAEVKQITGSLEEERSWAQELENERDQFRERLDVEIRLRENQDNDQVRNVEALRDEVKKLKDQLFKRDAIVQQCKNDLAEQDRLIKQKSALLEEKCQAYEEVSQVSEKRKKQIIQLRASVKTRDDALTEINNKHRALLSQCENNYGKRTPPNSPSALISWTSDYLSLSTGQKVSGIQNTTKNDGAYDCELSKERTASLSSLLGGDAREIRHLIKELEERDSKLKQHEDMRKQLILKLCNAQKQAEVAEHKLKKLEGEHQKAIRAIQGFMEREYQMDSHKERQIVELETELRKRKNSNGPVSLKDLGVKNADDFENDSCKQQRFEEMESKISDLRDQIETIKAEKNLLEKRTQVEFKELQVRLLDKEQKIEILEMEKQIITEDLKSKVAELEKLRHVEVNSMDEVSTTDYRDDTPRREDLLEQLSERNDEVEEKNRKIEQLTKELHVTTQNLQMLVNTELWSKNKEIAKLHNHMTASYSHDRNRNKPEIVQEADSSLQLTDLIRELGEIGVKVNFTNDAVRLDYVNGSETVDVKTLSECVQKLTCQRNDLEKEVDYLKWLKLVSKPDIAAEIDGCGNETERAKKYCELLRTHLKDLVKFMREMLKNTDRADTIGNEHKKIVLDVLLSSKILSDDFVRALEGMSVQDGAIVNGRLDDSVKRSRSENVAEVSKNQASQSDSETFSEPDRTVSMARIGLQEKQHKNLSRSRFTKYTKTCSDSEDSVDYVPYYKTYQNDLGELDTSHQIQELKETNNMLYSELSALRNDLVTKVSLDCTTDEKLTPFITKLERSQRFCEKLQSSLEKRIHEFHVLRKENKQNSVRKTQLEKKINDVEQMASEITKQKTEFLQYKENTERKTTETLLILNKENELLRARIKQLEEETETAKTTISTLRNELDHLTLSHSQIFVENTKLTNDKLRLEQDIRKMENRYDVAVRSLHDKFGKEIRDLDQINDSHRARVQELETANKEFRRHMAVCEASDSTASSSGVSSIPTDATLKQTCDILQEYQPYNGSQFWQPTNYSGLGGRSKSSCSPDLGIESDGAVTTMRPLKDTLKITESMTNLLSDEDNGNHRAQDSNSESPLPIEGLEEVEALKQENEALKRRLMKTRKALEDTFEHLSASNKNKKNVEKAIIKQLLATRTILKKTRTFDEPLDN
ncbi:PREDICTED: centrosomin-like isoform X2 [Wasmannia auropunctata]|uniref:centrosomin-like isoform X2 n=1 Tax=Wasmannia auropunctata TaxID=64793 RepID=UPI0005F0779C|nr:PREDICTED: centrosomin-like isoform X2 [Wasmannia auropunctata]